MRKAIDEVEMALKQDGYEIFQFESIQLYDEEDWEGVDDIVELVREARHDLDVHYGSFRCWENDD